MSKNDGQGESMPPASCHGDHAIDAHWDDDALDMFVPEKKRGRIHSPIRPSPTRLPRSTSPAMAEAERAERG